MVPLPTEITEYMEEVEYTSDYWYIIFVDKEAGRDYCLALTTKSFTREEAIAIAKTVRLVPFVGTIE